MAREIGPDQLNLMDGEYSLRHNHLADATNAFTIGARGKYASKNNARMGMVLVARSDEETSISSRALDIATERRALLTALACQKRAQVAFSTSLKDDHHSSDSAIAYFGSAECMVEEALNLEKMSKHDGIDRKKKIEKLKKHATKRYESAFMRNQHVNRDYDSLLPMHLDVEGARTLESVHERSISDNQRASFALVTAQREQELHGVVIGRDKWSDGVSTRASAAASSGKYDEHGTRAEKELAHFRKAHHRRMKKEYTPSELTKARNLIHQNLNASRMKDRMVGGGS